MGEAQELVTQLVRETETECAGIEKAHDSAQFAERIDPGVRLFYPLLRHLKDDGGTSYASRCTGWGSPSLLQELLLGAPLLVDLYDCKDMPTFRRTYGMSPGDMVAEIEEARLIPMINTPEPQRWESATLELLAPILKTGKVQLAHYRTEAFQRWFSGGKLKEIRDKGGVIFAEYFTCRPDEERKIYRRLRIHKYRKPAEAYQNVVVGRWRNVIAICPRIEEPLRQVFHDLRDRSTVVKAEVLNGIKNLVSSPVSAGRGGIYRASPQHIQEIRRLSDHKRLSPVLEEFLVSDVTRDFWTPTVRRWLEHTWTIPVPEQLNLERYRELIKHRHWRKFSADVGNLLSLLSARTPKVGSLKTALAEWEKETLTVYRRVMRSYDRIEYFLPLLGIAPYLGTEFVAAKVLYKVEELFGARGPPTHPGRMLAQLVWKARRGGWAGPPKS
jgi:hypothetical protein